MSAAPIGRAGILALALAAAAGGAAGGPPPADGSPLAIPLLDVASGAQATLEGGARLLHVVAFATWCRPCEEEIPRIAEWEARFGKEGYSVAIVAVPTRQSRERLLRYAREAHPPGRLLLDRSGALGRALGVDGLPAHVLLDEKGRVRLRGATLAEIDAAAVERLLGAPGGGEE